MASMDDDLEPQLPSDSSPVAKMEERFGAASSLTCPDCGGALWEVEEGRVVRYQCHTGHQYAPDALDAEQRDAVDSALWSAVRVLEEHAALKNRMAKRAGDQGLETVSNGFADGAREAHAHAQKIRSLLFATPGEPDDVPAPAQRRAAAAERRSSTRRQSRKRARKKPRG